MREDVNLIEIDLNVKKCDRGLKRQNDKRKSSKKKRIQSRTNPHIMSRRGDIKRQRKRVAAKQKLCRKK